MDDHLTFPPICIPAILPHPNYLMVTLVKDEFVSSINITTPLTPETIPNTNDACAALNAVNHLRQAFTSRFNTPDSILDCPTWLCMIMETLAGIHKGFRTMQLAFPDDDLPSSFCNLASDELNTVAHIFEITLSINDFCEAAEDTHDDDHVTPFHTLYICCVESTNLPPPLANITNIMLMNCLKVQALWETLWNQAICKAIDDIDTWHESQREALIMDLVSCITCSNTNFKSLACNVGNLDPHIKTWVDSIQACLQEVTIKMISQKFIEDCLVPYATELLKTTWMEKQSEITTEIRAKSDTLESQLCQDAENYLNNKEKALQEAADTRLLDIKKELNTKLADEIQQLKNKMKATIQLVKDEEASHTLSLVV